jgi:serine O-acetyltransferase
MMVVRIYRIAHWLHRRRVPLLPFLLKSVNRILFAVVLPPSAIVGRNVLFSYEGLGTIIHKRAVIGDDAVIGAGVTIGGRSGSTGVPRIGKGAFIGGGAKVIGDIRIGDYASIGANAVVMEDVPDYGVAVGIPARVVRINQPADMPNYRSFQEQ